MTLTMAQVINIGASRRVMPKPCAHCGAEPPLAARIGNRFVIACENDDCPVDVQASGDSLEEVWRKWNTRADDYEAAGAGSMK